jgi:hypothetical protein
MTSILIASTGPGFKQRYWSGADIDLFETTGTSERFLAAHGDMRMKARRRT